MKKQTGQRDKNRCALTSLFEKCGAGGAICMLMHPVGKIQKSIRVEIGNPFPSLFSSIASIQLK